MLIFTFNSFTMYRLKLCTEIIYLQILTERDWRECSCTHTLFSDRGFRLIPSNVLVNVDYKDMSIKIGREFVKKLNEIVNLKETMPRWLYIAYYFELFSDGDKVSIVTGRRSELHAYLRISSVFSRLSTILKSTTFKNILNWIYR